MQQISTLPSDWLCCTEKCAMGLEERGVASLLCRNAYLRSGKHVLLETNIPHL